MEELEKLRAKTDRHGYYGYQTKVFIQILFDCLLVLTWHWFSMLCSNFKNSTLQIEAQANVKVLYLQDSQIISPFISLLQKPHWMKWECVGNVCTVGQQHQRADLWCIVGSLHDTNSKTCDETKWNLSRDNAFIHAAIVPGPRDP